MGPGFMGLLYSLNVARDSKLFDSIHQQQDNRQFSQDGMDDSIPLTRSDFWMASMYCGLSMYWAFLLTTALTQRLSQSYRAPNVVLRIALAHLLSWVLIGIIIQSRPATQPIRPWVIITFGQALFLFVIAYLPWFRTQMKLAGFPTISDRFVTNPLEEGFMGREINGQSVTRFLVLPLVVVGLCSWMLIITRGQHSPGQGFSQQGQWQQEHGTQGGINVQEPPSSISKPGAPGNPNTFLIDRQQDGRMVICMIVLSSATPQGYRNRQLFRETTLKLLPSPRNKAVIVRHRFIIGEGTVNEQDIAQEHKLTGDLLIVNAPDTADSKSAKLYDAIKWADHLDFDYLVKTEDDVLVRMDTLSGELYKQGKKEFFWKGLVFKNVPNTRLDDMDLKEMPKFTDGTLTTLSRDIVALLAIPAPRYFVASSAQSLGIWLHGYGIKPVHDTRIQPGAFVCEEDLVAKHFDNEPSLESQPRDDPIKMVERINRIRSELKKNKDNRNFRTQISICDNRIQKRCAMCYSCQGRASNWKLMGFDCKQGGVIVGDKYRKPELIDAKQMEELLNRPPTGVSDELEMTQLKDYRPETRARIQAEQEAQRQAELERQQQNDEEESAGEDGSEENEGGDGPSEESESEEGSEDSGSEDGDDETMTSQDEEEALDESVEEGQGQQQDAGHDDHDESEMSITDKEVDYLDRRQDDETLPHAVNKKDTTKSSSNSKTKPKDNNKKPKRRA
ncbi:UDP-Gal betaGal beta 1,3-galactosyltransferase, polypeptide 6 [Linnemannia gamsii]|uniref:UDP-Gal betaGal beta 1,3-galactosyltransferase, polypeptide 6 n=1 Tax=Linnemannia gamsii TaxID=64522 RepID=A0A9P6UN29_9FUNG|nr:UDP-Gal betaGal beta 1,3-galactosyltransferase, polypeptide 6 [Linnemannia gamsii]